MARKDTSGYRGIGTSGQKQYDCISLLSCGLAQSLLSGACRPIIYQNFPLSQNSLLLVLFQVGLAYSCLLGKSKTIYLVTYIQTSYRGSVQIMAKTMANMPREGAVERMPNNIIQQSKQRQQPLMSCNCYNPHHFYLKGSLLYSPITFNVSLDTSLLSHTFCTQRQHVVACHSKYISSKCIARCLFFSKYYSI